MRPIKLSMTAFGPFVATETVDFTVFGEKPLFLINGTTGAGKTTILDAMCFALYGQTTGKEREAMQMRCDFAEASTATTVEFNFELAGQQYRILRIPEQLRAKKSGEGTTLQKPRAELWQLDEGGESLLVPEKVTEATQKIEALTGLQADQFRQVMVLPQGQFRRLLMADSKDREQIFSQLFETGIYKKIEDKLKQLASRVAVNVQTLKHEQQGVLQTVDLESMEDLQRDIDAAKPKHVDLSAIKAEKEQALLATDKAVEAATSLLENFKQQQVVVDQLQLLDQQKVAIQTQQVKLDLALQARNIRPAYEELIRQKTKRKTLEKEMVEATSSQQIAQSNFDKAQQDLSSCQSLELRRGESKQKGDLLKSYRQRVKQLQSASQTWQVAESKHQKAVASLNSKLEQSVRLAQTLKQLEFDQKQLEQRLSDEVVINQRTQTLKQSISLRKRFETLSEKQKTQTEWLEKTNLRGKAAAKNRTDKENAFKAVNLRWHRGQAALLAAELEIGKPC